MASPGQKRSVFSPILVDSNSALILGQFDEKEPDNSKASNIYSGKHTTKLSLVEPHSMLVLGQVDKKF